MDDGELLNSSKRRKIEDTILQILSASDLETATVFSVRAAAEERLGLCLSSLPHRRLVQQLTDSFLLATPGAALDTPPPRRDNDGDNNNIENRDYDGKIICKLSEQRMVTVHDFCGTTMVAIRDFGFKDGRHMLPLKGENSGLSLPPAQWSSFRNSFPKIQEAIVKLESRLRPEATANQSEADTAKDSAVEKIQNVADISNSTSTAHHPIKTEHVESDPLRTNPMSDPNPDSQEQIPTDMSRTEPDISNSVPPFPNQPHPHNTFTAVRPERSTLEQLVPVQPARLNGINYCSWRHQMEFLLNQLNIAYVLFEPCPAIPSNPEAKSDEKVKAKAAIQKWTNDDYLCRHNILSSLSDNLFRSHSLKNYSARELWEELKLSHDEDFGTKRSQINKYIQFQMVDGVSVPDQAQELGKIADSIIDSGVWVDENFHVGVVVSKLPPSWKDFRVRLLREDILPLNVLMRRLRVEEESRKKETSYKKRYVEPKFDARLGMRKMGSKRACYCCGKEGHISMNCPDRKFEGRERSNEKENGDPCLSTGNAK
ncbi:RNA polymerase ii transcriptional coactivator kelp [Phtheirospermum japonicum]|uniref:RNA polymerase ii transcriptional coactivator kelp n=1 Tax=Phtheirospermum japonicum TaxID=374723 RepID=A0A830DAU0_9LAMI|nr:RNA polymerase ii transcriptional coactivator kelp [Phtheirospermum japonicum]